MSYVPISTAGIGIPWGLYQKNEGELWFIAFALGTDFHSQDELFEPQEDGGIKLSVLPKLGMSHGGTPSASDLPANPANDNWDGLKHPRIKVTNASLSITDAALDLKLPVRLAANKSIAIRLGTLHASSDMESTAKIKFSSDLSPSPDIDLPQEEIVLKLPEELSFGVLLRLKPGSVGTDTKIVLDLKNQKIRISSFILEMGLICPMDKMGQNLLQLASPEDRKLSVKCSELEFPPFTSPTLKAEASEMSFPGLCPNFGTLFNKDSSVRIYLDGEWILTQTSLTGKGIILLKIGTKEHKFPIGMDFDLEKGSLKTGVVDCTLNESVLLDLGTMALELLPPEEKKQISARFDLASGDFWIEENGGKVRAYLPGNFTEDATEEELNKERKKRFLYDFVRPDNPLDLEKREAVFLLGPRGVSLFATQNASEVDLTDDKGGSLKPLQPLDQSGGIRSILEIRRNRIVQATFFARSELPGFSDKSPIKVLAEIGLRQQNPKEVPKLLASLQLEKADGKPLATLDIGPLECQVDELRMQLEWSEAWKLSAEIDGKLWLSKQIMPNLTAGLSKEKPACFQGLKLEKALDKFALSLTEPPEFELLDGMFSLSWQDLTVERVKNEDKVVLIRCDKAIFRFKSNGPLEVDIQPGSLIFTLNTETIESSTLRLSSPKKPISLTAKLGPSVTVKGQIQWVDSASVGLTAGGEKGIGLAGAVEITGLSPIRAAMYFGIGQKASGASVPSVFVYAETDTDVQLYPGVYLKSVGAGLGINRSLEAIGLNPKPERILPKLNTLRPGDLNAWKFVPEQQFFLSLVASIMVGSVAGDETQVSPFLLWMLLSIDSQANFAVAAKLWLSSSPKYVREFENFSRPAAEAAVVILPQKRLLSMRVATKKNPAIERDAGMKNILDSGQILFSYFMSPSLLDFYLEEASYSAKWVGLEWHVGGTFRTAIVSFGAMTKAGLVATASLNRELGGSSAGASFRANLHLRIEVAGLVTGGQIYSYALVGAKLAAQAKLWLRVSIKIFGKRISKSFSTSKRVNAALAGTMGFASSGSAGITGSVDIETSICGHDCSVSGRFNVNEELVQGVRSKVALFETRLNTFKARLLGLSTNLNLMNVAEPPTLWVLHSYRFTDANGKEIQRLLVLPTSQNSEWLGLLDKTNTDRPSFARRLTKIEVFSVDSGSMLGMHELSEPKEAQEQINFFGSCQDPHDDLSEDEWNWLEGVLLQDQRVRAESRNYWKEVDQERLADGVLPLDFRSLEEVEAAGKADAIFEEVFLYHSLNQRAHRVSRHSLRHIDPHNAKIRSLRGLVSQEALQLLDSESTPDHLPFVIVKSEARSFELTLTTVLNENGLLTYRSDRVPLRIDPLSLDGLRVCQPRQRCVVANDQQYLEVKLPISFDTPAGVETPARVVIGKLLSQIDSFEVYRQLPGEKEPTLLADNIQLSFRKVRGINPLDGSLAEQSFVILDPYLWTDYVPLELVELESVSTTKKKQKVTVLSFQNPKLKGSILPEVLYEIRVKPLSDIKSERQPLSSLPIHSGVKRVPLQLLTPPPSLGDLVAQLPVKALLENNPFSQLEIGRIDGQRFVRTPVDDPIFENMNHLEIWLEESKVDSGGFFGEEIPLRDSKRPESLEELAAARPAQSRRLKSQVGLWGKNKSDKVEFEIDPNFLAISEGYSYRVFVGHRSSGPWKGLLTELPCAILAEKHELGLRFTSTVERIPVLAINNNLLTSGEFDVRPTSKSNNILVLRVKPSDSRLVGGFEVSIRDTHEQHLTFKLEREMINSRDFPSSQMDFRCPARWEVASQSEWRTTTPPAAPTFSFYQVKHNRERAQLIEAAGRFQILFQSGEDWLKLYRMAQNFWTAAWAYQRTSAYVNSRDRWDLLQYHFRFLFTGMKPLDTSMLDLVSLMNRWSKLSTALLTVEEKDVEGLNDEEFDDFEVAARIAAITRHCQEITEEIFGNADSDVPVLKGDDVNQLPGDIAWPSLSEQERSLSASLREYFHIPNITKGTRQRSNVFLGDLLGTPIETILVAELNEQDIIVSVDSANPIQPGEVLLVGSEWMTVIKVQETEPTRWRLTVLRSDQETYRSGTKVWISHSVATMENMVLDDPNDIRKCVAHNSDLSNLLYLLKKHLAGKNWELVKRPHHTVQTTLQGRKHIPVNTKADYLLPQTEPRSAQPQPRSLSPEGTPIYLANLLERLGFAVDVAAYDTLGQPVSAELLYAELMQLVDPPDRKDDFIPQGQLVVWLPQENRGPEPSDSAYDSKPTSYGFLKVALIPDIKRDENGNDDKNDWKNLVAMRGLDMTEADLSYLIDGVTMLLKYNVQRVRPIGHRWLSLCSTGGNTISYWDGFDDKRHLFEFAVRAMSRYEPLLRWSGLLLPGFDEVFKAGTDLNQDNVRKIRTVRQIPKGKDNSNDLLASIPVYVHRHPSRIQFSYSLPVEGARALMNNLSAVRSGWQGTEVTFLHEELHAGVEHYAAFLNYLKLLPQSETRIATSLRHESVQRPSVIELVDAIEATNDGNTVVLSVDDTWAAIDVEGSYLLVDREVMKIDTIRNATTLTVLREQFGTSSAPHTKGSTMRLLAGNNGNSLATEYIKGSTVIKILPNANIAHSIPHCYISVDSELFWARAVDESGTTLLVDYGQLGTHNSNHPKGANVLLLLPAEDSGQLRMFRNERLVSSVHLPYCLRYSMASRVHYEYHTGQWPTNPGGKSTREPARISRWGIVNPEKTQCKLVLSRFWDLMTPKEQDQYRALPDLNDHQPLPTLAYLPDPSLIYDLYYSHRPDETTRVFLHLESLYMPLAPGAKNPQTGSPCFLKADEIPVVCKFPSGEPQFQVTMKWSIPPGLKIDDFNPAQLRLQIRRNALASTLRHQPDQE